MPVFEHYMYHAVGFKIPDALFANLLMRIDACEFLGIAHLSWATQGGASRMRDLTKRIDPIIRRLTDAPARMVSTRITVDFESGERQSEVFLVVYLRLLMGQPQIPLQDTFEYDPLAFPAIRRIFGAPCLSDFILAFSPDQYKRDTLPLLTQLPTANSPKPLLRANDLGGSQWPSLPIELLDDIFGMVRDVADEIVFPGWWLPYDTVWSSLAALSRLTRVCKGWYGPASRALLRIVALDVNRVNVNSLESLLRNPIATDGKASVKTLYLSSPWPACEIPDDEAAKLMCTIIKMTRGLSNLFIDNLPVSFFDNPSRIAQLEAACPEYLDSFGLRGIGLSVDGAFGLEDSRPGPPVCLDRLPRLSGVRRVALSGFNLSSNEGMANNPLFTHAHDIHLHFCALPRECLTSWTTLKHLHMLSINEGFAEGKELYQLVQQSQTLETLEYSTHTVLMEPPFPSSFASDRRAFMDTPELLAAMNALSPRVTLRVCHNYPFFPDYMKVPAW